MFAPETVVFKTSFEVRIFPKVFENNKLFRCGARGGGGGQTECIIGDAKVVNSHLLALAIENDVHFLKRCF